MRAQTCCPLGRARISSNRGPAGGDTGPRLYSNQALLPHFQTLTTYNRIFEEKKKEPHLSNRVAKWNFSFFHEFLIILLLFGFFGSLFFIWFFVFQNHISIYKLTYCEALSISCKQIVFLMLYLRASGIHYGYT